MTHLADHIHHHDLRSDSTLHVVGVISNPARYHSRYRLARAWREEMEQTPGVELHMVECAYGDCHHEVTETDNARHLQVRTRSEAWNKESLINLGVRRLVPHDARYIAWVDCDVSFRDRYWAQKTIHQLQHWPVVQPWQQCADLGAREDILSTFQSFGWLLQSGVRMQTSSKEPYAYGHTGYAWACRRDFWEAVNGLMDFAILGSADAHMAWAMIGRVEASVHGRMSDSFKRRCADWQTRALRLTHGQVGFVNGRIEHAFHGPKAKRAYRERWQILVDHGFDPDHDLMYDDQGLVQLVGKPGLEQAILEYNRHRDEDSTGE